MCVCVFTANARDFNFFIECRTDVKIETGISKLRSDGVHNGRSMCTVVAPLCHISWLFRISWRVRWKGHLPSRGSRGQLCSTAMRFHQVISLKLITDVARLDMRCCSERVFKSMFA